MTARPKFLFDNDFASSEVRPNAATAAQHQADLTESEARGYRNGVAAGRAEAEAQTARVTASALDRAASALAALAKGLSAIETKVNAEGVNLAVGIARKLAPELIGREPLAEIEALASECFRQIVNAPHVVVRLNASVAEEARARLGDLAAATNFGGRLIVLSEPDMAIGDCRIEWADGGVTRNRAETEAAIVSAVSRYLAGRGAAAPGSDFGSVHS